MAAEKAAAKKAAEKKADAEKPAAWPRPTHFAQLCEECGHSAGEVPDSATGFACEHGSWTLGTIVTPDPEQAEALAAQAADTQAAEAAQE